MATVLTTTAPAEGHPRSCGFEQEEVSLEETPLFQFRLRQLFAFVAAICALLTAMASVSGLTFLILLIVTAVMFMHVFATALGSRLQARTECECRRQKLLRASHAELPDSPGGHRTNLQAVRSGSRSPWHGRGCTYLPWLPRLVIGTMILGGLLGAVLLNGLLGDRTSPEGIAVGALSFAVLGGWISFLGGNFYGVFRHGFREALAEERKDHLAATRAQR